MPRPREFDPETALERAMEVFWQQGYDGTSLSDLTVAMDINRPSLYAAFGNKEHLFHLVLDRYAHGPAAYATAALELPTAREVVERLMLGAVDLTVGRGCLHAGHAQSCAPASEHVREEVRTRRRASTTALRHRLERADDLPAGTDPATLAEYVATVCDGIAAQAANGVGATDLRRVVELAMRALFGERGEEPVPEVAHLPHRRVGPRP